MRILFGTVIMGLWLCSLCQKKKKNGSILINCDSSLLDKIKTLLTKC